MALVAQANQIYLDYIVERQRALLHLVIDAVKHESDPPPRASDLEMKAARLLVCFPKTLGEISVIWNLQPRSGQPS